MTERGDSASLLELQLLAYSRVCENVRVFRPGSKLIRWHAISLRWGIVGFARKVAQAVYVALFGASRGATRLRSSVAPRLRIDFLGKAGIV